MGLKFFHNRMIFSFYIFSALIFGLTQSYIFLTVIFRAKICKIFRVQCEKLTSVVTKNLLSRVGLENCPKSTPKSTILDYFIALLLRYFCTNFGIIALIALTLRAFPEPKKTLR